MTPSSRTFRILIVDDHDVVLKGLSLIIAETFPEMERIDCETSGLEALKQLKNRQYDLIIADIELPDVDGLELINQIREEYPNTRILVNTMHEEVWYFKDIKDRIDGLLFKSVRCDEIARAIRAILYDGKRYFCHRASRVLAIIGKRESTETEVEQLTFRQLDVLKLLTEGYNTAEIALKLNISTNTVETHRRHLLEKFGARNVAELTRIAILSKLV